MVDKPDYNVGTVSVATGTKTVTGVGTFWLSAALNAGDWFGCDGYPLARIASTPTVNGTLTLQDNWRGPTLVAGSAYFIRYQPEGSRQTSETVALRQMLSQDALMAFGSLVLAANKLVYATGPTTFNLLDFPAWSRALVGSADIVAARNVLYSDSPPIVILTTGQSNFAVFKSMAWTPAENFKVWNNVNNDVNSIGTALIDPNPAVMNTVYAAVNRIAVENPSRKVVLINCSRTGQPISQWMTGAAAPDVFQCILNNVPPALAAAGATKIDRLMWWQGENGGNAASYPANFETVMNRFKAQSWFDIRTPVSIFAVANTTDGGNPAYADVNRNLQNIVAATPVTRQYVDSSVYTGGTFWDAADVPHMTALGYKNVGELAADIAMGRNNLAYSPQEEITFTPTIIGSTVAGVGTYSVQTGTIKRQGKRCDITVSLTWSAHTGTGGMSIVGIPLPAADQAFMQIFCSNLVFTGQLFSRIIPSAAPSTIQLLQSASGGFTQAVPMDTAAQVTVTGTFYMP